MDVSVDIAALFAGLAQSEGEPLYRAIAAILRQKIEDGSLAFATRLPPSRELAGILKVDRSTIARAYEELISEGLIVSHVGRGTFVAKKRVQSPGWSARYSAYGQELSQVMSELPVSLSPRSVDLISFAGGLPVADSYPQEEFSEILFELAESGATPLFDFSPASGEPLLRELVIKHLAERGMPVQDSELIILSGSQQGIDLMSSMFIDPGDTVVMEEPSYFWAISNFRARGANLLGVPIDDQGINIKALEAVLSQKKVKFIYLMPTGQNPTGITMSAERRVAVLELCSKFGVPIFEDDFAGDLDYEGGLPSLKALASASEKLNQMVVYQGTFSKALAPGIRLGWLVAPQAVAERLNFAKRGSDLSTSSLNQEILARFLSRGSYLKHLVRVRALYKERRDTMLKALSSAFAKTKVTFTNPRGGLFIYLTLPEHMDAQRFLDEFALPSGVSFAPSQHCYVNEPALNTMRLSFIQNSPERIEEGVARLNLAYQDFERVLVRESGRSRNGSYENSPETVLI